MLIRTPAKINLGLNVIRKREDGYHDLHTIFYPINLSDELTIVRSDNFSFKSSDKVLEQETDNLVIKAVLEMEKETGRKFNLDIYLKKNIPVGAGLGGGSSDAAAALLYLNKEYELNFNRIDLTGIALRLGSDVPFFLNPVPSFASSRGEELIPLNINIPFHILIVNPGIHISTAKAFSLITPRLPEYDLRTILMAPIDFRNLKNCITNDFEKVIFEDYPEIADIKSRMYYSGALFSLMSGSGSTVYGIFQDIESARDAEMQFRNKYFTFITDVI